jgi:hypothetical protein
MSLVPANGPEDGLASPEEAPARAPAQWYDKLLGLLFAVLCFEIGVFLIAFPWSRYWNLNYFAWLSPEWREIWINPYFRGAVSGLGLLNLFLSLMEVLRLQSAGPRRDPSPPRTSD